LKELKGILRMNRLRIDRLRGRLMNSTLLLDLAKEIKRIPEYRNLGMKFQRNKFRFNKLKENTKKFLKILLKELDLLRIKNTTEWKVNYPN
jgi:hypothetical protein